MSRSRLVALLFVPLAFLLMGARSILTASTTFCTSADFFIEEHGVAGRAAMIAPATSTRVSKRSSSSIPACRPRRLGRQRLRAVKRECRHRTECAAAGRSRQRDPTASAASSMSVTP